MLSETYPARYRDRFGEVATTIYNDGQELRMTLRDVEFILYSMEELEPDPRTNAAQLDQFTLYPNYGCVCDYTLEFDLPIPVIFHHEPFQGVLHVHLTVEVGPLEWNFRTKLLLKLDAAGYSFSSQGGNLGSFDEEFLDIQRQFPEDLYVQICFCCAYSDYSPHGQVSFGGMNCYRGTKQRYLEVKRITKQEPLHIEPTEIVQETYHCDEFERRKPGTGYRG
jgi:hypothetical protein